MQNNSNYQVRFVGWRSLKEEVGEDVVFFDSEVSAKDQSCSNFKLSMPYRMFRAYILEQLPAVQHILDQTAKHVSRWGMQESAYVRDLLDCGVDLSTLFVQYVNTTVDLDAEAEHNRKLVLLSADTLQSIVQPLEDSAVDLCSYQNNYYALCQQLEKQITLMLLEQYPQLFNSSSQRIRNVELILGKHVSKLASDLLDEMEKGEDE